MLSCSSLRWWQHVSGHVCHLFRGLVISEVHWHRKSLFFLVTVSIIPLCWVSHLCSVLLSSCVLCVHSMCDEASCTTPLLLGLVHCLPSTSFSDGELHVVSLGKFTLQSQYKAQRWSDVFWVVVLSSICAMGFPQVMVNRVEAVARLWFWP